MTLESVAMHYLSEGILNAFEGAGAGFNGGEERAKISQHPVDRMLQRAKVNDGTLAIDVIMVVGPKATQ